MLRANSELNRKKSRSSLKSKGSQAALLMAPEDFVQMAKKADKAVPVVPLFKPMPFWLGAN